MNLWTVLLINFDTYLPGLCEILENIDDRVQLMHDELRRGEEEAHQEDQQVKKDLFYQQQLSPIEKNRDLL